MLIVGVADNMKQSLSKQKNLFENQWHNWNAIIIIVIEVLSHLQLCNLLITSGWMSIDLSCI